MLGWVYFNTQKLGAAGRRRRHGAEGSPTMGPVVVVLCRRQGRWVVLVIVDAADIKREKILTYCARSYRYVEAGGIKEKKCWARWSIRRGFRGKLVDVGAALGVGDRWHRRRWGWWWFPVDGKNKCRRRDRWWCQWSSLGWLKGS